MRQTYRHRVLYTSPKFYFFVNPQALYKLGWIPKLGETFSPTDFCTKHEIVQPLTRLTNRLFIILSEEGYLSGLTNEFGQFIEWTVISLPPLEEIVSMEIEKRLVILKRGTPEVYNTTDVVALCGEQLDQILLGKVAILVLRFY